MRFLRQSFVGLFLIALTVALLAYAGQLVMSAVQERMAENRQSPPQREREFTVNVVTATSGTVTPLLEAFGEMQSRRTLELRASAAGKVVELTEDFEEGGSVTAGELLVRIDPARAQAALDRVESDLLDSRAEGRDAQRALVLARDELQAARDQADLRERAYQRQKDLQSRGVGTAASVETAELAAASARQAVLARRLSVAQAEARVDQAATRLARAGIARENAERDLEETTVIAAFNGTLSDVTLVEGRLVAMNEKLARLVDPDALEVAFRVSTAQYVRLLDGQGELVAAPVTATLDVVGADLRATGVISRDSAAAGEGLSGRLIFARIDSAPGFKPGDFVTVSVEEPAVDDVVRLPSSALGSDSTVLVIGLDNRLESLPVTLVRRQGNDVLVRGHGLNGRDVVTGRTPLLGAGILVKPVRRDAEAGAELPGPEMVELSDERRAKLVAFVSASKRMPAEAKARVLSVLENPQVPAQLVERIESRMGG